MSDQTRRRFAFWLWLLLVAFCGRVLGQIIVAIWHPRFLPPMSAWFSGLMPYRYLLPSQIVIIVVFTKVSIDVSRDCGYFALPHPLLARRTRIFGVLYLAAMILRYILRMSWHPDQRWVGGCIPIFFHWVLASYLLIWAGYSLLRVREHASAESA